MVTLGHTSGQASESPEEMPTGDKRHTYRLSCFYGHKSVIPFLPTNVSEGPVICDVLRNVGNFVNCMMMLKGLSEIKEEHISELSV